MTTWAIVGGALVAYVGLMVLVGALLRRRRRELDRLWTDLYAWEAALKEANREHPKGCTRGLDVPPPQS